MKFIALIPARSGSKRLPDKNIKLLGGHPLIAYSIKAAIKSKLFDKVVCATDSKKYAEIAIKYGAEVPLLRPKEISGDKSSDFDWVKWILNFYKTKNIFFDLFSIIRPTSPFRDSNTILNAFKLFINNYKNCDSMRAVELCKQHPGKMWKIEGDLIKPIMDGTNNGQPFHSSQYTALPKIYVQNASLEIAHSYVLEKYSNISGRKIIPFFTNKSEGIDINSIEDWRIIKDLLKTKKLKLPEI